MRVKRWEVYIQKPPADADSVNLLDYLGRYVQCTAISNQRIMQVADDQVTFEYYASAGSPPPAPTTAN